MTGNGKKSPGKLSTQFSSGFDVSLDANNRIAIPSVHIKQGLKNECYIVEQNSDGYNFLTIFTLRMYQKYAEEVAARGDDQEEKFRARLRAFFPRAKPQKLLASKPRITLDESMREHLGIITPPPTLYLAGVGPFLELWRKDQFISWWDWYRKRNGSGE